MQRSSYRSKKKTWCIAAIVLAVLVLGGTIYGICVSRYNHKNHADNMASDDRYFMNLSLTTFGQTKSLIGNKDVLVLKSVDKEFGGDTLVTFAIYQYEDLEDFNRALRMTVEELAADPKFQYLGSGEVTLRNDEIAQMGNLKVAYIQ